MVDESDKPEAELDRMASQRAEMRAFIVEGLRDAAPGVMPMALKVGEVQEEVHRQAMRHTKEIARIEAHHVKELERIHADGERTQQTLAEVLDHLAALSRDIQKVKDAQAPDLAREVEHSQWRGFFSGLDKIKWTIITAILTGALAVFVTYFASQARGCTPLAQAPAEVKPAPTE